MKDKNRLYEKQKVSYSMIGASPYLDEGKKRAIF